MFIDKRTLFVPASATIARRWSEIHSDLSTVPYPLSRRPLLEKFYIANSDSSLI